ncbi:MAG: SDR family NAD(P)-dependent oxidoreductase [Gemmatimonadetes bacterium]|nr:SDR family NAD(P)-dependent oxidoreductase [Gemmatimonadota bacterium]NIO30271.1 SDR family NAD(P)-dependent oxidoreductase [Gemmatimonadota bacterium]
MTKLTDKVTLITGAAGNLGRSTAEAFIAAGARVVLIDRAAARLRDLYPELRDSADHMLAEGIDASDSAAAAELVDEVAVRFGRIDALVNTVGTYRGGKPVEEEDLDTWDLLFEVNLRTTLVMCRAVIPMMRDGGGRIVNVGARSALAAGANSVAYAASKSAVLRLTEGLAKELEPAQIGVNCVLPGTLDTPQNRQAMPDADHSRWVAPEAVAAAILFLASDEARAVSGAALPV